MTVGALILVMAVASWSQRKRLPFSPWWPTLTLVWVVVQGLFGKYTVTLKLYRWWSRCTCWRPAAAGLLAAQHATFRQRPLALPAGLRRGAWAVLALLGVQIALGGWVSSNYAVLACTGFPQCNGTWWPAMDFGHGFTLLRGLGEGRAGAGLTFEALVAVHMAHRLFAVIAMAALLWLAWRLWRVRAPWCDVLAPGWPR